MDFRCPVRVFRLQNGVNLQEDVLSDQSRCKRFLMVDDHAEGMTLFADITGLPSLVVYDSPARRGWRRGDVIADVFKVG